MNVVIAKPDLDTCLAALICGVGERDSLRVAPAGATAAELADPAVLCIEAGGSGEAARNNFDHHDPNRYFPPACRQAWEQRQGRPEALERLVAYVCDVDERGGKAAQIPFPSLSNLFSGMLLAERDPRRQFFSGIALLKIVSAEGLDPWAALPRRPAWEPWLAAKDGNAALLAERLAAARIFRTRSGRVAGYAASEAIGGLGGLYRQGCEIAVLCHPRFGDPPRPKWTIASNGGPVTAALTALTSLEAGWGGRETIIGSPREGTRLDSATILDIVETQL